MRPGKLCVWYYSLVCSILLDAPFLQNYRGRGLEDYVLGAALAVVHYKMGQLEEAQDLYARAYDIQVRPVLSSCTKRLPTSTFLAKALQSLQRVTCAWSACVGDTAGAHASRCGDNHGQHSRPAQGHVQVRRGGDCLSDGSCLTQHRMLPTV